MVNELYKYGGSQAAYDLADILERLDDKNMSRKVGRAISQHNEMVNYIDTIPHPVYRKRLANILNRNVKATQWNSLPGTIQNYMRNIMIAKIRDTLFHE